jgi:hypothetical protein
MSNDLATILGVDNLVELGLDEDTKAVAGNATGGNVRISIEGRVFRKIVGGKEVSVNGDSSMNVIFVKMAHEASRQYYNSTYKKGVKLAPACWSNDSKTPDAEVEVPQASSCAECPQSVKGSGTGGTGTACRLSWRTAVVLPNDPAGHVHQLVLPATSTFGKEENGRWPFRPYVQMLANNNVSAGKVITKMEFDINSPVPRLLFSPVGAAGSELKNILLAQSKSPAAENAIKLTVYKSDTQVEAPEVADPVKRDVKKPTPEKVEDVSDIVKKWTKK